MCAQSQSGVIDHDDVRRRALAPPPGRWMNPTMCVARVHHEYV